jgi:hypothetical protein
MHINPQEAAMAAITFDALLKVQVREQIRTGGARFRSMLDAFVSNRMQEAPKEASYLRPRQTARPESTSAGTMTSVQFAIPFFPHRRPRRLPASSERKHKHTDVPPGDRAETPSIRFEALDPSILSDAIPAFFIGRNGAGFWVAREATGRIGGLFLLKSSALSFAREQSRPGGCAMIFPTERFELDLKNSGNTFARHLSPLVRCATSLWLRIEKLLTSLPHRSRDFSSPLN